MRTHTKISVLNLNLSNVESTESAVVQRNAKVTPAVLSGVTSGWPGFRGKHVAGEEMRF